MQQQQENGVAVPAVNDQEVAGMAARLAAGEDINLNTVSAEVRAYT